MNVSGHESATSELDGEVSEASPNDEHPIEKPTEDSGDNDENCNEVRNATTEKDAGLSMVIEKFHPYLPTAEEKTLLIERLAALGIKTLADLKFVANFEKDSEGVMKPIQCRRLEAALLKEDAESNESGGHTCHLTDVNNLFSKNFMAKLTDSEKLSNPDRLKFVKRVADDVYDHSRPVTKKMCRSIGASLIEKYPGALGYFQQDNQVAVENLADQIQAHACYMKKLDNNRKSLADTDADDEKTRQKKFSVRENFGIDGDMDLPNVLPDGETSCSQKEKQNRMIEMAESGEINMPLVTQLMVKTYASQRALIAEGANMEEIIKLWPFIGQFSILQEHFFTLVSSIDRAEVAKNLDEIVPKMLQFLKADTNKTRKGNPGVATKNIRNILKQSDMYQSTKNSQRLTMTLCLGERMQQDMAKLFIFFEETTSFDEVQASSQMPDDGRPIVAVLGSDVMKSPKCWVIVDKRCISRERISPFRAVMLVFMAYFVFKITYPQELSGLLEFFQRAIYNIRGDESSQTSSRVERKRTAKGLSKNPPAISPKFRTLMKDFESYCALWAT